MSCIIVLLTNFELFISWYFLSHFLKKSKNYIEYAFQY